MKKLFMVLMAALVMVSCGGSKSSENKGGGNDNGANNETETSSVMVSYGDSGKADPVEGIDKMISITETLLDKAERAVRTQNPEIVVSAFEDFVDDAISVYNSYGDIISKMSREEQQKYAPKIQRMVELQMEANNMTNELNQLQPSASQMQRLQNAAMKLQNVGR